MTLRRVNCPVLFLNDSKLAFFLLHNTVITDNNTNFTTMCILHLYAQIAICHIKFHVRLNCIFCSQKFKKRCFERFGLVNFPFYETDCLSGFRLLLIPCYYFAVLDVEAFERLLGPCMQIMKRNIDDYEEQMIKIFGSKYNVKDIR